MPCLLTDAFSWRRRQPRHQLLAIARLLLLRHLAFVEGEFEEHMPL